MRWRPPSEVVTRLLIPEIFEQLHGRNLVIYTMAAICNHMFDFVGDLQLTRFFTVNNIKELPINTHPLKPSAWSIFKDHDLDSYLVGTVNVTDFLRFMDYQAELVNIQNYKMPGPDAMQGTASDFYELITPISALEPKDTLVLAAFHCRLLTILDRPCQARTSLSLDDEALTSAVQWQEISLAADGAARASLVQDSMTRKRIKRRFLGTHRA